MRRFIRRKQTGIPTSTAFDWQQAGLYPKFFKIGLNVSGLYEDEHEDVIALRAAGASDDEIRRRITDIHQARKLASEKILSGGGS